eukprot:TRINITY_DN29961_c0_g1_i1.p1 TRINITY_DN29961_c0_g1~~TRINITY_DN29961_c0_g1_i1.p1  ORF type:complete len:1025 (+),score=105.58 TRINITY_DN29961_c0_g1_i1:424-3075(+)
MGVAFNQVLFGQLIGQSVTVALSAYSTPILSSSFEILPYVKVIAQRVQTDCQNMASQHADISESQCVAATLFWCTASISMTSGILMYIAGRMKLSVILRFLPNPLKMGIQAGLGVICISLGIELCCDYNFFDMQDPLQLFTDTTILVLWVPGMVSAIALYFFGKYVTDSALTIPMFFIVGTVAFHIALGKAGGTTQDAVDAGWLYSPLASSQFFTFWQTMYAPSGAVASAALRESMVDIALACFTGPILNCVGDLAVTESIFNAKELGRSEFNHEVKVAGLAHISSGLGGGFPSDFGNDGTLLHRVGGGKTRLSMVFTCVIVAAVMLISSPDFPLVPSVVSVLPKFLNGASLLLASFDMLLDPLTDGYKELPKSEYCVIWVVIGMTVWTHGAIESGLVLGLMFAFFVFVYHETESLKMHLFTLRSHVLWPVECEEVLRTHTILVADLVGELFFANAEKLANDVLHILQCGESVPSAIILDLTLVPNADATAADELLRMIEGCAAEGVIVYVVSPNLRAARIFANKGVLPNPLKLKETYPDLFEDTEAFSKMCSFPTNPSASQQPRRVAFSKEAFISIASALPEFFSTHEKMEAAWSELIRDGSGKISEFELAYAFRHCIPASDSESELESSGEDGEEPCHTCARLAPNRDRALQAAERGILAAQGFGPRARGLLESDVSTSESGARSVLQRAVPQLEARELLDALLAEGASSARLRGLPAGESLPFARRKNELLIVVDGAADILVSSNVDSLTPTLGSKSNGERYGTGRLTRMAGIRRQFVPLDSIPVELGAECELVLYAHSQVLLLEVNREALEALGKKDPQSAVRFQSLLERHRRMLQVHIASRFVMMQSVRNIRTIVPPLEGALDAPSSGDESDSCSSGM